MCTGWGERKAGAGEGEGGVHAGGEQKIWERGKLDSSSAGLRRPAWGGKTFIFPRAILL
jgi:hypothetical protein